MIMITMMIASNQVIRPSHDRGFQHRCKWMLWPVHHAVISLIIIIIILFSSSIMQKIMIICIMSIVAAQTWLLQVCQLGLHLVQHTCVHHAEGKDQMNFNAHFLDLHFAISVFTFAFISIHPWQKIERNPQYVFGSQSNGRIFGAENICNKANNWLFCGLWERCEGNHFYQQKVQVSVSLFGCYCTLTVENITDKTDNWENSWHFGTWASR